MKGTRLSRLCATSGEGLLAQDESGRVKCGGLDAADTQDDSPGDRRERCSTRVTGLLKDENEEQTPQRLGCDV